MKQRFLKTIFSYHVFPPEFFNWRGSCVWWNPSVWTTHEPKLFWKKQMYIISYKHTSTSFCTAQQPKFSFFLKERHPDIEMLLTLFPWAVSPWGKPRLSGCDQSLSQGAPGIYSGWWTPFLYSSVTAKTKCQVDTITTRRKKKYWSHSGELIIVFTTRSLLHCKAFQFLTAVDWANHWTLVKASYVKSKLWKNAIM